MKKKIKTGKDDIDTLYEAVRAYIENRGGSVVVIGGVQIVQMPDDLKFNWGLNIRVTGKKPVFTPHDTKKRIK